MDLYGLIGKSLQHSFSPAYFKNKFADLEIDAHYKLLEIPDAKSLKSIRYQDFKGLNVTIPFKKDIIAHCTELDESAQKIGAVNTLKPLPNNKLKGFNTDWKGFKNSILPLLHDTDNTALVLGTGGSSKAVIYALKSLKFNVLQVSRTPQKADFCYDDLSSELLKTVQVVVNTTPAGMFPNTKEMPPLPVQVLTKNTLVYDLIYNPDPTLLLEQAKNAGCRIKSGHEMLKLQAEASWEIWNS